MGVDPTVAAFPMVKLVAKPNKVREGCWANSPFGRWWLWRAKVNQEPTTPNFESDGRGMIRERLRVVQVFPPSPQVVEGGAVACSNSYYLNSIP